MENYNHKKIEEKWQNIWKETGLYKVGNKGKKKYYVLDMFPYPSGSGLHVGHPKGYIATDILARYKMLNGFDVLHPMGWDAFGLPAENDAIKNKIHPSVSTEKNIKTYKKQLEILGFTYDWDREVNTTDPAYYKWTQWAFLKMFEKGLVYESNEPINWCPNCKTGLANEDLEDGNCERCGTLVERKPLRQLVIKITDYADRLLNDLDKLPEWEESIKEMQKNWIGRSEGAEVDFNIKDSDEKLKVFTTRPDTLFGATYMVVCPEHKLLNKWLENGKVSNVDEIKEYIKQSKTKSDLERTDLNKDKSGVVLEGVTAINPVSKEEIPVYVADYVLNGYGTGAIMAVPAHDERDNEFAKKYDLKIVSVVESKDSKKENSDSFDIFAGQGINVNSDFLDGLETIEAKKKIIEWLIKEKIGKKTVNYKLKDWVFSRQRYWGEPIPLVHCEKCGIVALPESELPLKLPEVDSYEPSGTGESPLTNIEEWVNATCPKCKGKAKRETNTMPQWAGSSWYYLRYMDPKNENALVDSDIEKHWSPVDFYVGGAEHATRHLIYARFWHKFLFDIGVVSSEEPFTKFTKVGLILSEDGRKMSKRWGNVINPDDVVNGYGADAMRIYEMFMGPFDQAIAWSTNGLTGAKKFLDRIWNLQNKISEKDDSEEIKRLLYKTMKKVGEDIEGFKFNTAISTMMILVNKLSEQKNISVDTFNNLLLILCPFAPHITEELWSVINKIEQGSDSLFKQPWPQYDEKMIVDTQIELVVQVNGKLRDTILVDANITEEEAKKFALDSKKVQGHIKDKEIVKVIFVKGKLISIVVK